jgi:hypothetical protein
MQFLLKKGIDLQQSRDLVLFIPRLSLATTCKHKTVLKNSRGHFPYQRSFDKIRKDKKNDYEPPPPHTCPTIQVNLD